ncbi:MAG: hypothetical protein Kow0079_06010 [Vicingaceae bacterium]
MDRKEFLSKLSKGAVFSLAYTCLCGCVKMENPAPPTDRKAVTNNQPEENVDFTIDLTEPQYAPLQNNGGFVIIDNKYVVAKNNIGEYVAATRVCSDQYLNGIVWQSDINQWRCVEHNATFDQNGNGTTVYNNLGYKGLTIYNTSLNGNLLRIYS